MCTLYILCFHIIIAGARILRRYNSFDETCGNCYAIPFAYNSTDDIIMQLKIRDTETIAIKSDH